MSRRLSTVRPHGCGSRGARRRAAGQPGDASARLRTALGDGAGDRRRGHPPAAPAVRRPRTSRRPGRVVSFFEANETARVPALLEALRAGEDVLVVTDAGMPSVSDPGYRLVAAAVAAGIAVTVLPGPSAVTTALAVSGLPVDRFCFEGFLPRRRGRAAPGVGRAGRRARARWCSSRRRTGWPTRCADLAAAFGADRPAAVCRELTKTYEEVRRGTAGRTGRSGPPARSAARSPLVVAGASPATEPVDAATLAGEVADAGSGRRDPQGRDRRRRARSAVPKRDGVRRGRRREGS